MPFLSVIIPIYNSQETLKRCVDSIINNNHNDDYEILLINDGSTDESGSICKEYAEKSNVIYIEKQNGGVSSARNVGLDNASGKYVAFVDSDDYVSEDYIQVIRNSTINDEDFVMFSHFVNKNGEISNKSLSGFCSCNSDEIVRYLSTIICNKKINSPWAKAFKRDIIEKSKLRFDEKLHIGEDKTFIIQYCTFIKSIKVTENSLYYVCLDNENSLSRRENKDIKEQQELFYSTVRSAIQGSQLSEAQKEIINKALNYLLYAEVYSSAKRDRLRGASTKERLLNIICSCKEINKMKLSYPNTRFCKMICIPVKLKLVPVIDLVSLKLSK